MQTHTQTIALAEGRSLEITTQPQDGLIEVMITTGPDCDCILHWGLCRNTAGEWAVPPETSWPSGSVAYQRTAVQTPFAIEEERASITIRLEPSADVYGIGFVIYYPGRKRWDNNRGRNYLIRLAGQDEPARSVLLEELSREIVHAETGRNSWTLMHRFNLCHDLLDRAGADREGLALLFVWLRFSALRQLDWQRNYNTKPRELSHAQDRLTLKIAELYLREQGARELLRLMLATLGRGGEGQRVRDEILAIMHRHHLKEVSGHFLEEWHQKLHNNTTPDDIVICEAYLAFLRADGHQETFYRILREGGVSRERLASYERPIRTAPDFVPYLKEGLIRDFTHYLAILRSVHSGTDLATAVHAARYLFDAATNDLMTAIIHARGDFGGDIMQIVGRITALRRCIADKLLHETDWARTRDLLFLDISLEEYLRTVIERSLHTLGDRSMIVAVTAGTLDNLQLSYDIPELQLVGHVWQESAGMGGDEREWALRIRALVERIGRIVAACTDRYYELFQPEAESLGRSFRADAWVIGIFSEEVARGRLMFVMSMLLRKLDPLLRGAAHLGNWQVISPAEVSGRVRVAENLRSLQGKRLPERTVIVADRVSGDEEPPEGAVAIITPDLTDIVSHISIRARNARILFATCYDASCIDSLKALEGKIVHLSVNPSGDVAFRETTGVSLDLQKDSVSAVKLEQIARDNPAYVLKSGEFTRGVVGVKSLNLTGLSGRLPAWIHVPAAAAIPFGVCERVLEEPDNRDVRERIIRLREAIDEKPGEALADLKEAVAALRAPAALRDAVWEALQENGIVVQGGWDAAWRAITGVWASKWNERAYFSRKARGIPDDALFMAVLIQEAVAAEYAFVLHTVNPSTGDEGELYGEVVAGLGETLVGNYPGRALGFTADKKSGHVRIGSYPSKSAGLFGGGVFFRSDSNGEDLSGYAGAGLYDSIQVPRPCEVLLDYTRYPLIWYGHASADLLRGLREMAIVIEQTAGSPQDIEGAYVQGRYYLLQTRPQV